MRITTIGGGPPASIFRFWRSGAFPQWSIRVLERNRPLDTFGWGVVFSDATLENLRAADEPTHREITQAFAHWDDIDDPLRRPHDHVGRSRLLRHLAQASARDPARVARPSSASSCDFETDVDDVEALRAHCDLLVGADGINSRVRGAYAAGVPTRSRSAPLPLRLARDDAAARCVHVHLRADRARMVHRARLSLRRGAQHVHRRVPRGDVARARPRFGRHASRRSRSASGSSSRICAATGLMANSAHLRGRDWLNFTRVSNEHWVHENVVLLGDAAHTAHFSVGSGTKLAMEDAIGLADALERACATRRLPRSSSTKTLRQRRGAQAAERGAQLDGVVRERRALCDLAARAVRLQPADAQPAHRSREPAPARYDLRRARSSVVRRRRVGAADVHAVSLARSRACATASSSRRWTCTARSTVCPTTFTSFISVRARSAAPG